MPWCSDPIYLLEGKFTDPADKRNYSMSLWIDGAKMSSYFPPLSQLPRNTHVVVTIALTGAEAQWRGGARAIHHQDP